MPYIKQKMGVMALRRKAAERDRGTLKPLITYKVERYERFIPTSVGDSRALIYYPLLSKSEPLPVFVNFHGGGFVFGSAMMDDPWCPVIANQAGCVVVNVDYRLAPEHKFPIALYECYDVVQWLYQNPDIFHIDPQRIAVGGHSAGGNLAAAICLLAKKRQQFPIVFQVLDYPPLDLVTDPELKPKFETGISPRISKIFNECYLHSPEEASNPLVSPILAENLQHLPAALIITAEYDSLADEAEVYADHLKKAGVEVIYQKFQGVSHGFTHSGTQEAAEKAWNLISEGLIKAFRV